MANPNEEPTTLIESKASAIKLLRDYWFLPFSGLFILIFATEAIPESLIRQGDYSFEQRNYPLAFKQYQLSSLKDPANPLPHFKLALVQENVNNWEDSRKELLLALDLSYDSLAVRNELEKIREITSEPSKIKEAIASLEEIIKDKPDYRDVYLQLAYYYYQLYEDEKAKERLERALKLDPNYPTTKKLQEIIG